MSYKYQINIPAATKPEAEQKISALAQLAGQLDGRTLDALAKKIPGILRDPIRSKAVKSYLGL